MYYFEENGYEIVGRVLKQSEVEFIKIEIAKAIDNNLGYAIRHLDKKVPAIANLANSTKIINLIANYYNRTPRLIRSFNKTQDNNWFVPWHQDKTIAVREKIETPGFQNWTTKQGIIHVQPPLSIMQQIITLRIHLDKTNINNGALQLIPKSHQQGILTQSQINNIKNKSIPIACEVYAGDVVIMNPLILHSSLKSQTQCDRAIIHLEYSAAILPNNLTWA